MLPKYLALILQLIGVENADYLALKLSPKVQWMKPLHLRWLPNIIIGGAAVGSF